MKRVADVGGGIRWEILRHAYDFYYDPNFNNLTKDELDRRAIEEANKYRKQNNELLRAYYE